MKRLIVLVCAALAAACSPPAPTPAARTYANEWLLATGESASINLHETALGLAGRLVRQDGEVFAVRGVVRTADRLSFIVPALNASYSAAHTEAGWSGEWTDDTGKRTVALTPTSAPAGSETWITLPDGRQMHMSCVGSGGPAVIFDAGAGSASTAWGGIPTEIGKTTQACAYDRAGLGLSDPGPLPRDVVAVADDLEALLTAGGVKPPYVLVGHSLGSYHVRQFANTRADKTTGLVLVDPSGDGQDARFAEAMPRAFAVMNADGEKLRALNCPALLRAKLVRTDDPLIKDCNWNDADRVEAYLSEVDAMTARSTPELARTRRSWGAMPVIVLSRGDYDVGMPPEITAAERETFQTVWSGMHREMAALSTAGQFREVPGAGHGIQRDKPQAVVDAVLEVVAAARAGRTP